MKSANSVSTYLGIIRWNNLTKRYPLKASRDSVNVPTASPPWIFCSSTCYLLRPLWHSWPIFYIPIFGLALQKLFLACRFLNGTLAGKSIATSRHYAVGVIAFFFVAAVCLNSRMGRSRIKKAALRTLRRQCGQKGGSAAAGGGSSAKTVQKKIRLLELRGSSEIPSHDFMHSPKKESTVRSRNGLILDLRAFVIESVRGIFAVWIFV